MVQVYTLSHGATYSSLACTLLKTTTFLRIPRTHLTCALPCDQQTTLRFDLPTDAVHPVSFLTLPPMAHLMESLDSETTALSSAVVSLLALLKKKEGSDVISPAIEEIDLMSEDSSSDED